MWWAAEFRVAELPVAGEHAELLRTGFVDPDGFDRHGFDWGGDWRTPDGMHFELRELTEPPA